MRRLKALSLALVSGATLLATLPASAQEWRERDYWHGREEARDARRNEWRREHWRWERERERQRWLCFNRGICRGYYSGYYTPPPPVRRPGFNFELNLPND